MRYKVGDKVRIKSIDWYKNNKDERGDVICDNDVFPKNMQRLCGRAVTIIDVDEVQNIYTTVLKKDYFSIENHAAEVMQLNDEMIEGLVEEETLIKLTGKAIKNNEMVVSIDEFNLPQGYQFVDENGNVINATKIVLEKKKKEYPKTFEECCKILGLLNVDLCFNADYRSFDASKEQWKRLGLMNQFYQLLICRDAYWKLYGDEMGLGKPWEPDWNDGELKWCMSYSGNYIEFDQYKCKHHTLAFPTEEMRDAFYENFKELIEQCKELL